MLFMMTYRPLPGKAVEAIALRQRWNEKYSQEFRKHVKIIQEFADPCRLRGYLVLEAEDEKELGRLLALQSVFGDTCEFELHPVVDVRKALAERDEEPSVLL
jgi:hypothetical protein